MHSWARKTRGHLRTFHTPTRDKDSPTAGGGDYYLSSNKVRFFPNVFLLAGLAQTVMILNTIQFCTNSLLSPHINHQTDSVTPLTGSCTRQVRSTAHPADPAGWQSGFRSHTPPFLAHSPRACTDLVFPGNNTWAGPNLDESVICHNAPHSSSSH